MRGELFDTFINNARVEGDLSRGRHHATLEIKAPVKLRNAILKQMLWIYVIEHPRMASHQFGQRRVVRFLTRAYAESAVRKDGDAVNVFPRSIRAKLEGLKDSNGQVARSVNTLRIVADHVSGMTDAYALMMHARLTGSSTPFHQFL